MAARRSSGSFGGAGLLLGMLLLGGCEEGPGPTGSATAPEVGSVSLSLTLGGGYQFTQVSYDISGNGFHKADVINVATSTSVSTIVGGIPFGSNYLLKLTAQEAAHKLTPCEGMTSFSVSSTATIPVPVHLTCHEVVAPPPAAVPVPLWASFLLGAFLLAAGAFSVRRASRVR
jgi:hypothetical protein